MIVVDAKIQICSWASWGDWGDCTAHCDGGTSTRTRECDCPEQNDCPGFDTVSVQCNTQNCGCAWGDWDPWNPCSTSGVMNRTQSCTCTTADAIISDDNPSNCPGEVPTQESVCNTNCQWGTWGAWSSCTAACGDGTTSRTCVTTGMDDLVISSACSNGQPCCSWEWQAWSDCSDPCNGVMNRGSDCVCLPDTTGECVGQEPFDTISCGSCIAPETGDSVPEPETTDTGVVCSWQTSTSDCDNKTNTVSITRWCTCAGASATPDNCSPNLALHDSQSCSTTIFAQSEMRTGKVMFGLSSWAFGLLVCLGLILLILVVTIIAITVTRKLRKEDHDPYTVMN